MSLPRRALCRLTALLCALGLAGSMVAGAAGATTSSPPSTTTTTTTTTTPVPTPAQLARAQSLLDVFRRTATTLDQLETTYFDASTAVARAKWVRALAVAELASSTATYERLRHRAVQLAVHRYESSSAAGGGLSAFSSPAAAGLAQDAGVYDEVAAARLDRRVRAVERLRSARATITALATAQVHAAATSRAAARGALRSARNADAHLLTVLSSLDPGTRRAVEQLQRAGDDAVEHLLAAGSLSIRAGVATPPPVLPQAAAAVAFAAAQIGTPYRWGATGPDAYDCSGLVLTAWAAAGIALPRVAIDQAAATIPISYQDLQPGDLVFFESPIGHVGIYVGDGSMIDAPYTGASVQVDSIFWKDLAGFGRVIAP